MEQLTGFVKKRVPEAHLESCLAREVDYILPIDKTSVFSELFNLLNGKSIMFNTVKVTHSPWFIVESQTVYNLKMQ